MATDLVTTTHPRRVTVVTPNTRVDLALPLQATVAEVVLQVVALVGAGDDHDGAAGGWLLGRLGATALDPGSSVASTNLSDGDVLYLSPRSARLPPALFDDVVDAVAVATSNRPDRWDSRSARWTALAVAAVVTVAGLQALATAGPAWSAPIGVAVGLAALLLTAAAALSRAVGDAVAGAVAAFAALPYAAWAAARGVASPEQLLVPADRVSLLVAGGGLALAAVLGGLAVGDRQPAFGAVALVGAAAAAGGGAAALFDAAPRSVAAVLAASMALLLPTFPMRSVRLAKLPLPTVPTDMAEFRSDERPATSDETIEAARRGDAILTGLLAAFSAITACCAALLVVAADRWSLALACALSVVLLLRGRHLLGRAQRLLLLIPGLAGLMAITAVLLAAAGSPWRIAAAPVAVLIGALLVNYASRLPRRGAAPYTDRLLDVAEFLAVGSLLPLAAAVLGAYSRIRGLGG